MLEVKAAVEIALRFLGQMYSGSQISHTRLEEVELAEDGNSWHVTLSYLRDRSPTEIADAITAAPAVREFKVITILSDTGEVKSMKIRQPV